MKLYCMRHGEAVAVPLGAERCLTEQGEKAVQKVAEYLAKIQAPIAHIIHSDTLRTKQTAEVVANHLKILNMSTMPILLGENSEIDMLCDMLPAWDDNTLLVGHFPFMTRLVKVLANADVKFKTATIVCLQRENNNRWTAEWVY
ncbi:MAG: phosphohistidine phosphatase SixA [Gammaproteobacteria bacterium]|nr:phosphohistidine phosphatase SixA [Gammaproteobacteria bacterium]